MPYAYEVLLVLNGLEPIDTDTLEFAIITDTDIAATGPFTPFLPGEVLVLNRDGREPFGECRKPAKYPVTYETVATLAEAMELRRQVLDRVSGVTS